MMTLEEVFTRARSMLNRKTVYWAGDGGDDWKAGVASETVYPGRIWAALTAEQRVKYADYAMLAKAAKIDLNNLTAPAQTCDCSGYICWVLKMNRKGPRAAWTDEDGRIYTGSIWDDANGGEVKFENLYRKARPGALLVYPKPVGGERYGHIALVTKVDEQHHATQVLSCSARNFKTPPHDAIAESDADVFYEHEQTLTVWCRDVT